MPTYVYRIYGQFNTFVMPRMSKLIQLWNGYLTSSRDGWGDWCSLGLKLKGGGEQIYVLFIARIFLFTWVDGYGQSALFLFSFNTVYIYIIIEFGWFDSIFTKTVQYALGGLRELLRYKVSLYLLTTILSSLHSKTNVGCEKSLHYMFPLVSL